MIMIWLRVRSDIGCVADLISYVNFIEPILITYNKSIFLTGCNTCIFIGTRFDRVIGSAAVSLSEEVCGSVRRCSHQSSQLYVSLQLGKPIQC